MRQNDTVIVGDQRISTIGDIIPWPANRHDALRGPNPHPKARRHETPARSCHVHHWWASVSPKHLLFCAEIVLLHSQKYR